MLINIIYLASIVIGFDRLTKTFLKRDHWFSSQKPFTALHSISANLSSNITAFIGPSGSGKSTLAKILSGREDASSGNIYTIGNKSELFLSSYYLDPLLYMQYDSSKSVVSLLGKFDEDRSLLMRRAIEISKIPVASNVDSLLMSQRRAFEVLFALSQITSAGPPLLVLDEWLDRDASVVRGRVGCLLRDLCKDPDICLRVLLVTHSRGVLRELADHVIVLKQGVVFNEGNPVKITLPSQLLMLD